MSEPSSRISSAPITRLPCSSPTPSAFSRTARSDGKRSRRRAQPVASSPVRTPQEILCWAREMLDPALYAAVDRLPPATRQTAGYHFGWRKVAGQPRERAGGKALRPTLCLLTAAAAGTHPAAALPAAV